MGLAIALLFSLPCSPPATELHKFTLRERVGHDWNDELVHYPVSFARGECRPDELQLEDEEGQPIPLQLTDVEAQPDGSVARGKVAFIVTLPAGATRTFTLGKGPKKTEESKTDLAAVVEGNSLVLSTSAIGVKLAWGEEKFDPPRAAAGVPAPIQQFRLRSGAWNGKGWLETRHLVTRFSAKLTEDGPVYKQVLLRYEFQRPESWGRQEDPFYTMTVRVVAGQEIATFAEEYNLGDAKVYQPPRFASESQEMLWDWWSWRPHAAPDNFCLSLTGAFRPTHARTIAHNVTSPDKGKGTGYYAEDEYPLPAQGERFEFALNPWARGEPDQSMVYTLHRPDAPDSDVVSIVPLSASRWLHPDMLPHEPAFIHQHTDTGDLRVYTAKGDVVVRAPLHLGRREWGLVTLRNPGVVTDVQGSESGTVISRLTRKYGAWPLDKVKDWVLDWPVTAAFPHLFIQAGDLQGLRVRIKSLPALEEALRSEIHVPVHRWLLDAHEEDFERAFTELLQTLDANIRQALIWPCGGERTGINAFPWHLQSAGAQADVLLGHPGLTEARKKDLLARLAFLSYVLWDGEYMPPRKTGYGWGSANMPVNVGGARGILAALLSDHPRSKVWAEASAKYFGYVIEQYFGEDGSPLSCPHYMPTTGGPVITVLLALQNSGLVRDPAKLYPKLRKFGGFLVDLTTPVDVRFGQRMLPTIGDSYWEGNPLSGQFAALFKECDPHLAGSLMWTWLQGGRPLAGFMNAAFFFEPRIELQAPPLKSSVYPGFGAFLHHAVGTPEESYVAVRFGTFAADHMHSDAGSWHWYARGAPLSLDFASMYTPHTADPWWHNTLSYNHAEHVEPVRCPGRGHRDCFYTGRSWFDHTIEPHTGWAAISDREGASVTDASGRIESFAAEPGADYIRGEAERKWFARRPYFYREEGDPQPSAPFTEFETIKLQHPFRWVRQIAYVTGSQAGDPEYMFVADDLSGNQEVEPAFNFWCLAAAVQEEGRRYLFTGQHGIDLDMTVLEPRRGKIELREWGHKQGFLIGGNGLEENQKVARVFGKPDGGGFRVVLHPRKGNEPRPVVDLVGEGKLARIAFPGETHWVLLAKETVEASDGPVRAKGTAAVIRRKGNGATSLTLLAPGKIECAGAILESEKPASVER